MEREDTEAGWAWDEDDEDDGPIGLPRWLRVGGYALAILLAAGGIAWYVAAPRRGYDASALLVLPLAILLLVRLHRILPRWLEWTGATLLALVGIGGYLLGGGSDWWSWGQVLETPLVALLMHRIGRVGDGVSVSWPGRPTGGGPWGPP